jgi:hypothetical protein
MAVSYFSGASGDLQVTRIKLMNECNEGEERKTLPAQQTEQPQPAKAIQNEGWPARIGSLAGGIFEGEDKKRPDGGSSSQGSDPDSARFTAGVVRLYEAILKEPIPGKMLRLVEKIAEQERKS